MPLDLSYLFHSSMGFDDLYKVLQNSSTKNQNSNYPPYNILKLSETLYRISIALAGFSKNDIELTIESNILNIRSIKFSKRDTNEYLYKGIANRAFEKKFQISENIKVENAFFKNGLLNIDLIEILPKKEKVFKINIQNFD